MTGATVHRLGITQGTALYVGGILGPGVLALPGLAAAAAGPASVVAWVGLVALSVPVAFTFAALGGRFPDGGGVAGFTARAFGPRLAAAVGWWFYFIVPIGVVAAALIGGEYVTAALGMGHSTTLVTAAALLIVAFAANHVGLRLSGPLQLVLAALLAALLVTAVLAAAPSVRADRFAPFVPYGWGGVGHAVSLLFFAFVGWEAGTHLSADFADPRRQLPRVSALALIIVGTLYTGLAVTTVGVLGRGAASSPVPLALLLQHGIGRSANAVTAVAALFLTFGAINTYIASAARLGAALARDGALPRPLAAGDAPGAVPRRSLALLGALTCAMMVATVVSRIDLDVLLRATGACLAAVMVVGTAAAVRLLRGGAARATAVVATVFTGVVLALCGAFVLLPAGLAVAAMLRAGARADDSASAGAESVTCPMPFRGP
ncbi:MAG TPA: amino acid permease [Streptosporangiaceae bacterium]